MKRVLYCPFIIIIVVTFPFYNAAGQGIASHYYGDKNIQLDSNVVFTEMAEESNIAELLSRWSSSTKGNTPISLDTTTSPPNSLGKQSMKFTTTGGISGNPGTVLSADLFKQLDSEFNDSLFFRCYIKYNTSGTFHHSGLRIGGAYPATPVPRNFAGNLPNDSTDQFFYVGAEVSGAYQKPVQKSMFDFYNYWRQQRHSSFFPDSVYYGNSFINSNTVSIDMAEWNCIEVRVKLNIPPDSSGEISMWINGNLVSYVKHGITGTWIDDDFFPGAGSPFEGFSWRGNDRLKLNFIWLTHFVDHDPAGHRNSINYDHIVVAKKYIGPIVAATGIQRKKTGVSLFELKQNYPNPFNPSTRIEYHLPNTDYVSLKVYDGIGREVATLVNERKESGNYSAQFDGTNLSSGIYVARLQNGNKIQLKKMLLIK